MAAVNITKPAEGIARIAINRPDKRNALNAEARHGLIDGLGAALADDGVRAIVLTGEGGHFCAGGDVDSMEALTGGTGRARLKDGHRILKVLVEAEKPVIAAVEGFAAGAGASLAMLADTIVMGESAAFAFPFFNIGLIPDLGLMYSLPRRVGLAKARQMLIYARRYKGEAAMSEGLADEMVADDAVQSTAIERATELANMPSLAFALAKQHLGMWPMGLDQALEMEAQSQGLCFTSDDHAEGRNAFMEKRKPNFR